MNKISACLIVKNEGYLIDRCLGSFVDVVDEIIVVHDGCCADKTLEICKKYGAKVFVRDSRENFNSHRVFSFEQAKYSWILQIDADEYLSDNLKKKIRELADDKKYSAYEFSWPLWSEQKQMTKKWPYKRCFFRKDRMTFWGILHFVPWVDGKIKKSDLVLVHRPKYDNYAFKVFFDKWIKKARVHAEVYLRDFKDIEKFNDSRADWPKKNRARVRFPVILMPFEFIITFFKTLSAGAYREGCIGVKIALMHGAYRVMINYYIFKLKSKEGDKKL